MTNYIIELKNRLILLFIMWCSVVTVCYVYKENLLFLFLESELFSHNEFTTDYFIFTDISEVFSVYIELCLFLSLQLAFIYFIIQSFVFASSGLFKLEYYYFKFIFKIMFTLWLLSVFMAKYFLIPMMYDFFFNFKNVSAINLHFEAKLHQYFKFYTKFYSLFILYLQIFGAFILFFNYTNVNNQFIKNYRKIFHYCFILFATLFSPPDVFSQLIISSLLIVFYEVFIFCLFFRLSLKLESS